MLAVMTVCSTGYSHESQPNVGNLTVKSCLSISFLFFSLFQFVVVQPCIKHWETLRCTYESVSHAVAYRRTLKLLNQQTF